MSTTVAGSVVGVAVRSTEAGHCTRQVGRRENGVAATLLCNPIDTTTPTRAMHVRFIVGAIASQRDVVFSQPDHPGCSRMRTCNPAHMCTVCETTRNDIAHPATVAVKNG